MIKPSDITVTVYKDPKTYGTDTIVRAGLEITEIITVNRELEWSIAAIERAKEMARHGVYQHLYGGLTDLIEEMYAITMVKMPFGPELDRVREIKGEIDKIKRGEE